MSSDPVQDQINTISKSNVSEEVKWYDRSISPPPGLIWATDGNLIWLIYTDGVIPDNAFLVRQWSNALIPKVPSAQPLG